MAAKKAPKRSPKRTKKQAQAPRTPDSPASRARARREQQAQIKAKAKAERLTRRIEAAMAAEGASAEPPPDPPDPESTKEDRVAHCAELMATGHWHAYITRVRLSAAWGVEEKTVRDYAAEASRRLRVAPEDVEAGRLAHAKLCEDVQRRARTTFNELTGMPDFGAELKAIELTGRYLGIDEDKKRIELTGADGGPIETRAPVIMVPPEIQE